jgi:hypothetical protein
MPPQEFKWIKGRNIELVVDSWSSVTDIVQVVGYTQNEQIIINHTPNSDRSQATTVTSITEMPQNITARMMLGTVLRGQCYVKISIRVEGVLVAVLSSGYVTSNVTLAWPYGKLESSLEGPGFIRTIYGTDQAAGAEISETVPDKAVWRPKAISFTLVTDATVTTRIVRLRFFDGLSTIWQQVSVSGQAASNSFLYTFIEGGPRASQSSGVIAEFMPQDFRLSPQFLIETTTANFQAGDNFSRPILTIEEWLNT